MVGRIFDEVLDATDSTDSDPESESEDVEVTTTTTGVLVVDIAANVVCFVVAAAVFVERAAVVVRSAARTTQRSVPDGIISTNTKARLTGTGLSSIGGGSCVADSIGGSRGSGRLGVQAGGRGRANHRRVRIAGRGGRDITSNTGRSADGLSVLPSQRSAMMGALGLIARDFKHG